MPYLLPLGANYGSGSAGAGAKNLEDFSSWEAILHAAWSLAYKQGIPATVKPPGFSDLVPQGQSGLHVKHEQSQIKIQDVVGSQSGPREPVRDNVPAHENPLNLFMGSFSIEGVLHPNSRKTPARALQEP